jgi:hypothetical protein
MTEMLQPADAPHPSRKRRFPWHIALAAVFLAIVAGFVLWGRGAATRTQFAMAEVSFPSDLLMPPEEWPCEARSGEVTRYPQFKSASPLYGRVFLSYADRMGHGEAGYFFAIDESKGTGKGYDTFYLDANHNLDLTDDRPSKASPVGAGTGQVFFDPVTIPGARDDGTDASIAPRLSSRVGVGDMVAFPPATVRQGRVRIAGKWYVATMIHDDARAAAYDNPRHTSLSLSKPESAIHIGKFSYPLSTREEYLGYISTTIPIHGSWCDFLTTASGDTLTVRPYAGDLGLLQVSCGGKTAGNDITGGGLRRPDGTDLGLSPLTVGASKPPANGLSLPVGDYSPEYVMVRAGQIEFMAQRDYAGRSRADLTASDYYLKVRKDKPCLLEIDSTAEIVWFDPSFQPRRPGQTVDVYPRLSTHGLLIHTVRAVAPVNPTRVPPPVRTDLVPTVLIQDSTGRTLTQGPARYANFHWTIPPGFAPRNGRETLKVTVSWDTQSLFGVVTGTKEIDVESTGRGDGK